MASYISSNANRFYTALESAYGKVEAITAANRIPAVKLGIQQQVETGTRRDKTGSRTFAGLPAGVQAADRFRPADVPDELGQDDGGARLRSAVPGGTGRRAAMRFAGGTVASSTPAGRLGFGAPHGLSAGQAVCCGGEIRFVAAIVDAQTVQLNAPFTVLPAAGATIGATVTYAPATELTSVSIFDYWSPSTAVQRLLCGAAVDQMEILINGDYHEFHFSGMRKDVVDSSELRGRRGAIAELSGGAGAGGVRLLDGAGKHGTGVAGNIAVAVLHDHGATIAVKNELDTRNREFGSQCAAWRSHRDSGR